MRKSMFITAALLSSFVGLAQADVLVGWDSFDGISWGGGTATAPVTTGGASGSMTVAYGVGASGGDLSTVSWSTGIGSSSGTWGGLEAGASTQLSDGTGNYVIRSGNNSGTVASYLDLNTFDITITAGANGLVLTSLVFDAYKNWGWNAVGIGLEYTGGNLVGADTDPTKTQALLFDGGVNVQTTSTPGVNVLDLTTFSDNDLAPGESATFRLYAGGDNGNEFYLDNFAILGSAAIPEPATLGLIGFFGLGTLFIRRRLMM